MYKTCFLFFIVPVFIFSLCGCFKCGNTILLCPKKNDHFFKVDGKDTFAMYIPNIFTPNGDGNNDRFMVFGKNMLTMNCKIYDGLDLVYTVYDFADWWDGFVDGKVHVKVYTIFITATTNKGEEVKLTGTLSLMAGQLLGSFKPHVYEHLVANYENAQFPIQHEYGQYDPTLPSGEYLVSKEINACFAHK